MKTGGVHNVPVVMQMESTECGAASLAMILAYHGLWLPLSKLRYDCGVSRDGSSLDNIAKAARNFGMQVKAFKLDPEELSEVPLPCIAHWDFEHFVVISGVGRDTVYLNDPARGRVKMSFADAGKSMTGVVMTLSPGPEFKRGGHRASILTFVRERLRGARQALIFTFLVGLILTAAGMLTPILTQIFADDVLTGENPDWFTPLMIIFGLLLVVQVVAQAISGIYSRAFRMKLSIIGNSGFLWHMMRLPMRFFEQHSPGDLIMRLRSAASVASSLVASLAPLLTNLSLLVLYLIMMLRYNLALAGIAAFITVANLLLVKYVAGRQVDLMRVAERNRGRLNNSVMASLQNIESIKAAGAETAFFTRWTKHFAASYNADVKMNRAVTYLNTLPQILITIGNTTVLGLGAWFILQGRMTIGMLMSFQSLMNSFVGVSNGIGGTFSGLLTMRAGMERMEDVYRAATDPMLKTETGGEVMGKLRGKLEMRNVSFGYNRLEPPLVENFNLVVEPGRSVALVGATGCGKSTIAKMIAGINIPWEGEILYDGRPASDINRSTFVNSIAVIDQDHVIFKGTVADNVKMWDGTIEDFAMIMACYQARIHHEIASRPDAYDTDINEAGSNFSTGQCQRMEIAGALVREPSILIMDEATSALDARTEDEVMKAIREMGVTTVIVAHRLSTIRDCDEIVVLDRGHVVERGTHDELMERRGKYHELMNVSGGN